MREGGVRREGELAGKRCEVERSRWGWGRGREIISEVSVREGEDQNDITKCRHGK